MGIADIPVVGIGPGSQPLAEDEVGLDYIDMPKGMHRYRRPDIPEPEQVAHLTGAKAVMNWIQEALNAYRPDASRCMADISGLDDSNRELVNQILGEGEVGIRYTGAVRARIQESVLAGVWRSVYLNEAGRPARDLVEVADVPFLVRNPVGQDSGPIRPLTGVQPPPQITNAAPILTELEEHRVRYGGGDPAHVINLTLLPLSAEDLGFLDKTLGRGPVAILSRGYGDCRITSTAVSHIWWVRYHTSMGTLILNTLEVTDVPQVACAAPEDLKDSASRLGELLEPYWTELG
jgi:hydrogenase-1 operon protein HyaF